MSRQGYIDELERALARPDAKKLTRQIDAYAEYFAQGCGEWPNELDDDFLEITTAPSDDPNKALAYVVLAAARSDDAGFLGLMGCGALEDILQEPSRELIDRIVAEARKSPRFRWLLNNPFRVAVSQEAWEAIEPFRFTGPHEEPALDTLPPP